MDEILYELRDHSAGLNCGRWDYIFSYIKKLRAHPDAVLPDRALVTMTVPFMRAYSLLTIATCHRRGAHAMGGMSAYIPIKGDARANEAALAKVREDKEREAGDGHDGTWLAHPDLVPVALEVFDRLMPAPNQVGMEDAATAEICRAQVWQWLRSPRGVLRDGRDVEPGLVRALLREELAKVRRAVGDERYAACRYYEVSERFEELAMSEGFEEFLTLGGYEQLE